MAKRWFCSVSVNRYSEILPNRIKIRRPETVGVSERERERWVTQRKNREKRHQKLIKHTKLLPFSRLSTDFTFKVAWNGTLVASIVSHDFSFDTTRYAYNLLVFTDRCLCRALWRLVSCTSAFIRLHRGWSKAVQCRKKATFMDFIHI